MGGTRGQYRVTPGRGTSWAIGLRRKKYLSDLLLFAGTLASQDTAIWMSRVGPSGVKSHFVT